MKNLIKLTAVALFAGALSAEAQVKYKVSRSEELGSYTVSMVPEKSLQSRESIVGTMQVTLKVKSDERFNLGKLTSHNMDAEWENGAILRSPDDGKGYDYISFNLRSMGSRAFTFKEGEEVKLFTIENSGSPEAVVELIENDDELANSNKINIKNHISVLGFGRRNAYSGNTKGDAYEELARKVTIQKIYPNPTPNEEVTIEWKNLLEEQDGEIMVVVTEPSGREVMRKPAKMSLGQQSLIIKVQDLEEGSYLVGLMKDGVKFGKMQKLHVQK